MCTTFRTELPRKSVHIAMGGFALLLRWMTPWQAVLMGVAALGLNLFLLHPLTGGRLLRPRERDRGNSRGVVVYPAVLIAVFVVFQSRLELAAGVWGLLAVGDGMAALAGLLVGGPKLPWNRGKTWSGVLAFTVFGTLSSAFLIRWTQLARGAHAFWPATEVDWVGRSFFSGGAIDEPSLVFLLGGCLIAASLASIAESLETSMDDNVLVPFVGSLALAGATLVTPAELWEEVPALASGLMWGVGVTAPLAALAFVTRSVDRSGAVGGVVVGSLLWACVGWTGFLLLAFFVTVGVGMTRLGEPRKVALGIAQESGGRRGAGSALANTGIAVACGFLVVATPFPDIFQVAMVAAFATALFDTAATEVGKSIGRRHFLPTTWSSVPAGTNGAVSLEGTVAGGTASIALVSLAVSVGVVTLGGAIAAGLGAAVGSMTESVAGALLGTRKGSDSEVLNLFNTIVGGAVAVAIFQAFF